MCRVGTILDFILNRIACTVQSLALLINDNLLNESQTDTHDCSVNKTIVILKKVIEICKSRILRELLFFVFDRNS